MKQTGTNKQQVPDKGENQKAGDFEAPPIQADNLARIATALENIADTNQQILSCAEDQLEILKEINQEFYSFSRHGFGF